MKKVIHSESYRANAPDFSMFNVGDTLVITEDVKQALEKYESSSIEPNIQGIIESQAQACDVLSKLFYGNVEFKNRSEAE
jgi:hypothetical protein